MFLSRLFPVAVITLLIGILLWLGVAMDGRGRAGMAFAMPSQSVADSTTITPGSPGLSFRFVQSFGVTETPYLADNSHINRPRGLYIDDADNLYVTERNGNRILKYNKNGEHLLTIGYPGICLTGDYNFCPPRAVTTDAAGNLWVGDDDRIAQYSPTGEFLQQLPVQDPWLSGSSNDRFWSINDLAFNQAGLLFVSDHDNHRIQVYDLSSGSPVYNTTIGVSTEPGDDNQHFRAPRGIAFDSSGRLYVADTGNQRVQRCQFNSTWQCQTFYSQLNDPYAVVVLADGRILIADLTPGRVLTCTDAGSCSVLIADFDWLNDLAVDSSGNIYGSAQYEGVVYKFASNGSLLGIFAGEKFVHYQTDLLHYNDPRLTIDKDDNIIIVEELGKRLIKLDKNGLPLWSHGHAGLDRNDNEHFENPANVTSDATGKIYVADDIRVQIFSPAGAYQFTIGGQWGQGDDQFAGARGVAVDKLGNLYVADAGNHRVQIFNNSYQYIATLGVTSQAGSDNSHFSFPSDVEIDAAGNLYVADADNCRVQKFDANRLYQMTIGMANSCQQNPLDISPFALALDEAGRIYVSGWSGRVHVFDHNGAYVSAIGSDWGTAAGDFRGFMGSIAIDSQGSVYVSDAQNARIQKFGRGVPGWLQTNVNGFGDRLNRGIAALEPFDKYLYASILNYDAGSTLWRSEDGNTWQQVATGIFPSALNNNGLFLIDLIEFKGALYAGIGSFFADNPIAQLWRSPNGTAWEKTAGNGFGNPQNLGITTLGIYSNTLYAATLNNENGTELWGSTSGNLNDWVRVASNRAGLGTAHQAVSDLIEFRGQFYAALKSYSGGDGAQVWRSTNGTNWQQSNQNPLGAAGNDETGALAVFHDQLYVSVGNNEIGGQIWASPEGLSWTQRSSAGFGNANNNRIELLFAAENALYAVTTNEATGSEVWRTLDGSQWQQVNPAGFGQRGNSGPLSSAASTLFQNRTFVGVVNNPLGGTIWQITSQTTPTPTPTATSTTTPTPSTPPTTPLPTNTATTTPRDNARLVHLPIVMLPPPTPQWLQVGGDGQVFSSLAIVDKKLLMGETVNGIYQTSSCTPTQALQSVQSALDVYDLDFRAANGLAATFNKGLFYSTDSGVTWQKAITSLPAANDRWYAVAFAGTRAYAGSSKDGIFVSNDHGINWSRLGQGPKFINRLVPDPANAGLLWVAAGTGTAREGVGQLALSNHTYQALNTGLTGSGLEVWDLLVISNTNRLILATTDGVYQRIGNSAWQPVGLPGVKVRSLESGAGKLFAGTENRGVWSTALSLPGIWAEEKAGAGWSTNLTVRDVLFDMEVCSGLIAATSDGVWLFR